MDVSYRSDIGQSWLEVLVCDNFAVQLLPLADCDNFPSSGLSYLWPTLQFQLSSFCLSDSRPQA